VINLSNDKVIFLNWLRANYPTVDNYFGKDQQGNNELDDWANDTHASHEYDQLFSWHKNVRDDLIHGWVIAHGIGEKEPSFPNTDPNPYDVILAFFGLQLEHQTDQLSKQTDPTAQQVIQKEIDRTNSAIKYYTQKQKSVK
jgi:hypothetical protein